MPFSRYERRLEHSKAYKLRVVKNPPNSREGSDGDMVLCVNRSGMKLYVKYGAEWFIISEKLAREWTGTSYERDFRDSALSEAHKTKKVKDNRNAADFFSISGNLRAIQNIHLAQAMEYESDHTSTRIVPDPKIAGTGDISVYFSNLGTNENQLRIKNGALGVYSYEERTQYIACSNVANHADGKAQMIIQSGYSDAWLSIYALSPNDGWSIGQQAAGTDLYIFGSSVNPSHGAGAIANGNYSKFSNGGKRFTLQSTNGTGELQLNRDKGSAGAADDVCGKITFYGDDANQDNMEFARIEGVVQTETQGQEGGKLKISVASHDGEMVTGLELKDGSEEDEIDVNIASGANSVTTIAGDLDITGSCAYVDAHQMHSVQDNYRFTATTTGQTYFKNIDTLSQDHMWSAFDSEDDTVIGNTISLQVEESVAGLIVPYACKLKGVRWVGGNDENVNHVVLLQTWTGSSVPDNTVSTTGVTATLRSSISLTNYNRKYFNQSAALDVAMAAGTMIYPAFQYVSGGTINYHGSVIYLLERA